MKITITGVDLLEEKLTRLSDVDWEKIWQQQGDEMMQKAERITPYRTGQLLRSAYYDRGEFGYTADYAPHVNYGHRTRGGGFVPGQHFLEQVAAGQDESYKNEVLKYLKETVL